MFIKSISLKVFLSLEEIYYHTAHDTIYTKESAHYKIPSFYAVLHNLNLNKIRI